VVKDYFLQGWQSLSAYLCMIADIMQNGILDIYLTNQAVMLFIFRIFKSNLSFDKEKLSFY
jgi:hypothetical protein